MLREGKLIEDPALEDEPTKCDECNGGKSSRLPMVVGGIVICGLGFLLGKMQAAKR